MEKKCLKINQLTEENIAFVRKSFPLRYKAATNKAKKEDSILSLAGTYLLSQMLPSLKEDDIKYKEMGKPVFDDGFFSISHSGDRVYVVTSKTPVGVDVESINRPINSSIVRLFTENEQSWIAGDNLKALKIWCLKEAVLKAVGYGITKPLDSFDVAPFMDGNQIEYEGRSWNGSVAEEDGYIVAVVEEAE